MIFTLFTHAPYHFPPLDSFCPHIILPPPIILPPRNHLIFYTIKQCPISFFPLDSFCPPPPLHYFAPWKLFNDLHYLSKSHIIFPPGIILPSYHFAPPPPIILPPWKTFNDLHFTHVLYHFSPWIHFAPISFCPRIILPWSNLIKI